MTTTIEITYWPCSETYAQNPTMMDSVFRQLLGGDRLKGLNDIFSGIDIEKQNAFAVLDWDTVQDHMNFVTDKERQAPFVAQFASARKPETNDVAIRHIVLPVKEGASLNAVQAIVAKYVAYANSESTPPVAAVYGQEVDNPEELCLVIGWNSTEDKKVSGESAEVKALVEEMAEIGEYKAHTAILQQVVQA